MVVCSHGARAANQRWRLASSHSRFSSLRTWPLPVAVLAGPQSEHVTRPVDGHAQGEADRPVGDLAPDLDLNGVHEQHRVHGGRDCQSVMLSAASIIRPAWPQSCATSATSASARATTSRSSATSGRHSRGSGKPARSTVRYRALRRLAAALYRAGAHCDLADIHHQADQEEQARYHWQQALDLYTRLGAHEAHQVQPRLSELKAGTAH